VSNGQKKWEEILALGLDETKWRDNKGVPSMEHIFPKFIFYNIFFYVRNITITKIE
jgi:hypothetical protein